MSKGDLFLSGMIVLQLAATVSYAWDRDVKQACVWGFVALSNIFYLSLART